MKKNKLEKELSEEIKSKVSTQELEKYEILTATGNLKKIEQEENLALFLKIQKDYARRIEVADKLAQLQSVSFKSIIQKYGLLNETNV